jgi:amino acid adenylation domain-containing protein
MNQENIQQLFARAAEQFRANTAITDGERHVTYEALECEANRLANFLLASGAKKGAIVCILAESSFVTIPAIIGVLKAGCVFVPLDPRSPVERLAAMAAEVSALWFVVEAKLFKTVCEITSQTPGARVIILNSGEITPSQDGTLPVCLTDYATYTNSTRPAAIDTEPDDMVYVYFTSGSSGRPKGIMGRLKGIDHFIRWEIKTLGIGPQDRGSQFITPAFDAYLRDIFVPLCAGGTVCVPASPDTLLDGRRLIEWIEAQRISLIHCVPSLFRSFIQQPACPSNFSSLRYVLLSGEPLLPADVAKWVDDYDNPAQLVNLYGPTETTMTKLFYFVQPADKDRRSIPIGQPMEGARALIVSPRGQACPRGKVGEIYIRTPFRSLGYYQQPELTNRVFISNPFNDDPNDLVYKTGDLGRVLEDDNFEFLGRTDQQVKIRGIRIELGEIESLLQSHELIRDVAVVAREDTGGSSFLCAYLVVASQLETAELKEYLARFLPDAMIPSAFVVLDTLPRTLSGKVDRGSLPAPGRVRGKDATRFVAPRTPQEVELAAIWSQVLGIPEIGIKDNFFELGGHSLLATQLLSRVRTAFNVELSLRALFRSPTVEGLSLAMTQLEPAPESEAELAGMIEEIKNLSPDQLEQMLRAEMQADSR